MCGGGRVRVSVLNEDRVQLLIASLEMDGGDQTLWVCCPDTSCARSCGQDGKVF